MAQQLNARNVEKLDAPVKGNRVYYDSELKGFGLRVTAAGARSYIVNYRTRGGTERRMTLGALSEFTSPKAARDEARHVLAKVRNGADPLGEVRTHRKAETVADLCQRFDEEHIAPNCRPSTARDYRSLIEREIKPGLGRLKVADVAMADVAALHRKITRRGAAYVANRTLAILSKMFALAMKWKLRSDNPVVGLDRNDEVKRKRYLKPDEIEALSIALAEHEDRQAANVIRLLMLTGARKGEVLGMRWDGLDLATGVWTKPAHLTKQNEDHTVPLSAPALQLLVELRAEAERAARDKKRPRPIGDYVFPGRSTGHRQEIKHNWRAICIAAGIVEKRTATNAKGAEVVTLHPTARIHDLRHTYASVLVSSGLSLPIIGALLGHTQPATTARYAHIQLDPMRRATDTAGAILSGRPKAEVHDIEEARG